MQERVPFRKAIRRLRRLGPSVDKGGRLAISGEESFRHMLIGGMIIEDESDGTSLVRTNGSRSKW